MGLYGWIKLIHILSATVLFGTGIGTAFFMLQAHLSANPEAMRVTARHVVLADALFTTPAVVVQLATGVWLSLRLQIPWGSAWFLAVLGLFLLVGLCWLPVVWLQLKIRDILAAGGGYPEYRHLMRAWIALGVPGFVGVLLLFYLMVSRAGMTWIILA